MLGEPVARGSYSRDKRLRPRASRVPTGLQMASQRVEDESHFSNARDLLRDATDEQMSLISSGRFDHFKRKKNGAFIKAFLEDPLFLDLFAEAERMAPVFEGNYNSFQQGLHGVLFEKMAYACISSLNTEGIPLMGEKIVEISKALNPGKDVRDFGFGQVGVWGIYVPDGYVVNAVAGEPKIEAVLECKLAPQRGRSIDQKKLLQAELDKLGMLAIDAPEFVSLFPELKKKIRLPEDITVLQIPIKQEVFFTDLFPYVYTQHVGTTRKTLATLRKNLK